MKKNIEKFFYVFSLLILSLQLQGCMDAAVSGAQALYNRKSWNNSIRDHYISMRANQAIYWNSDRYKHTHVEVNQFGNVVLITGEIPSEELRKEVVDIVKGVADGDQIYNATELLKPTPPLIRLSDSWITTKVRAKLMASNNLDPGQVDVVTENSTVFLVGIVFQDQADEAVEIARTTQGVRRVVKVFSYLHLTKK